LTAAQVARLTVPPRLASPTAYMHGAFTTADPCKLRELAAIELLITVQPSRVRDALPAMSAALAAPGFSARIQAFAAVLKDAVALTFTTVGRVVKTAVNRSVPVRSTTTSTQFASPGVAVRYPTFRRKLAELEIDIAAVGMTEQRVIFATSTGKAVGAAAASIRKPKRAETMQRVTALAMEALGVYAAPDQLASLSIGSNTAPIWPDYATTPTACYLNIRASTIYGRSSEVQHNIMVRAAIGLSAGHAGWRPARRQRLFTRLTLRP
jgi:hypothetical protein